MRSAVELAKLAAPAYAIEIFPTLGRTGSAARMWPKAHLAAAEIKIVNALKIFLFFFPRRACALGYVSGAQTHAWGGPGLSWVAWPTRRRRATAAAPRSFVRGSAVGLDFSLQCTAARAGYTREGVRTAFANRLCESLRCIDLRER